MRKGVVAFQALEKAGKWLSDPRLKVGPNASALC
jgi:hypothetical protein